MYEPWVINPPVLGRMRVSEPTNGSVVEIFYTQLVVAQVAIAPMLDKMELINLQALQVTVVDANQVVQLT
jgi:hypothetical protein